MEFWVKQIEIMEFWCLENGAWITWTQIRQINNPRTSGRWCLCLHNLNKTMLHMWPIKWDETKCYWQWVVMTEQEKKSWVLSKWGQSWHLQRKRLAVYLWQRRQLCCQCNWSLLSSFKERNLSRGDSGLIGMACSSLWAASAGEAANEVPVERRFVCCKSMSAENWTRHGCIGTAVCGKGKARTTFSSSLEFSMTFPLQAVQGEETKALSWLIQRKGSTKSESFRAPSYC